MDALTGAAFIGSGLVQTAVTVALYFWGSAIAARRGSRVWWWARWMPLLALGIATLGVIGTVVQLVAAFDAVALAEPERKAVQLADAISRAMWFTAVTTVPSGLLYLGSIVAFTWGTLIPVPSAAPESRIAPPAPVPPRA